MKELYDTTTALDNFVVVKEKDDLLIKLIAIDGLSINVVVKSETIRAGLSSLGYKLPNSGNTVRKILLTKSVTIKGKIIEEIKKFLNENKRFSITIDEYTAVNNQKYLNINLHINSDKIWTLGLICIVEKAGATKIKNLVVSKLAEYGLDIEKDIIACVSDGASAMVKAVALMKIEHHLCYSHTLQLAINNSIYKGSITIL